MAPHATVTFLFTDIEGSTHLWESVPDAMGNALARHDALIRTAVSEEGGDTFKTMGDAFYVAFADAIAAIRAAIAAQRALAAEHWQTPAPIRARMAIHTGSAERRDEDWFGPPLNRVARLLALGHGGQTLMSGATAALVRDQLPDGVTLRDLGRHAMRDIDRDEHVFQVNVADLAIEFPALRSAGDARSTLPTQLTSFVGRGI